MTAAIPAGRPADMPGSGVPDRDLVELVRDSCLADPDNPALIFEDGVSVSRSRLWAEIESFAGYLGARIKPVTVSRGLSAYSGPRVPERPDEARGDLTNIFYTSGTTGPPKGCAVGHDYWIRFADLMAAQYSITAADRMICCLQFFYNDPPWMLLMVVMRRFSVSRYWQVVRDHDVTVLFGIASTASLLLRAPVTGDDQRHKVRLSIQVGIPSLLHQDLVDRWGVPWAEAYGLTETGVIVAVPVEQAEQMMASGSIGLPCPGADVRVFRPDGTECADGQHGEIVVRAPGLMRGYLNSPEAAAQTLVETVLRSHPGVLEVAAVPVADELLGEEVKVHVLLGNGHSPASVPPAELITFSAGRLARYKVPRFVEYRAEDFISNPGPSPARAIHAE
jgi:carnitine-CoA ligase